MQSIRRGKKTDAVFAQAVRATHYFFSFVPNKGTELQRKVIISIEDAKRLFDENKRVKLSQRTDGVFVYVIGTHLGYDRVEIEIA